MKLQQLEEIRRYGFVSQQLGAEQDRTGGQVDDYFAIDEPDKKNTTRKHHSFHTNPRRFRSTYFCVGLPS